MEKRNVLFKSKDREKQEIFKIFTDINNIQFFLELKLLKKTNQQTKLSSTFLPFSQYFFQRFITNNFKKYYKKMSMETVFSNV